ncbi:MAG: response regulator [Christensenella sp.]
MKQKVLIVDDMEVNRAALDELLHIEYDTLCACSGSEAIRILERERDNISLVLLDLVMPDVNGYDVLQYMNFNGIIKHTPVMLVTAADTKDSEEKGLNMGAVDFIRKPYAPKVAKRRIKNVLELYGYQSDLETVLEKKSETLSNINEIIVAVLTSVLETKTPESKEHIQRVRLYTRELLKYVYEYHDDKYGLSPQTIETICMASVLHDIGELLIPEQILRKSMADRSKEETLIWQQHTIKGCKLLEPMKNIENKNYIEYCYDICRYHHEKWDGSGFPDKLSGEEIPLCAQAVGLAHRYDREAVEHGCEQAVQTIQLAESNTYSPVLMETFSLVAEKFKEINDKNPELGK